MLESKLLEIGCCISKNDETVIDELKLCIENTGSYYENNQNRYEERGINYDSPEDIKIVQWIALVDCLIERNYICELDWKCEKEDFLYFLSKLKGIEEYQLSLDSSWFDENESVVKWCSILDNKWKEKDTCLAALDINSDSYVIFPISIKNFRKLKLIAKSIKQRIELAENM